MTRVHGPRRLLARLTALPGRTPLRVKLVAVMLLLVAVALAATGLAATAALRGYLVDRVDQQLLQVSPDIERRVERNTPLVDRDGPGRVPLPGQLYVRLAGTDGRTVDEAMIGVDADDTATPRLPTITLADAERRDGRPFSATSPDGHLWRAVALPLDNGSQSIVIALGAHDVQSTVGRLVAIELVLGALALVLLGLVAYVVVRRSLRPLVEVEHTAAAIAAGDLSRRVPERDTRTEVGRLGRALNGMLAQIEQAFRAREASESAARASEDRMRRFVADASHELRTPLTSIRGFAELYRQGAAARPEDVARAMRRVEDEAARMGLLVDDLLLLARLDQQRPLQREPVDLLAIATDVVHDAGVLASDREVTLEVADGTQPPVVLGDEARLRQVVGNLVSNALTHTPAGTTVRVRLGTSADGGSALLAVQDHGPGLSEEDAARVFERFYRSDKSRTRSAGGTGLGLSIVAALVAAHGGSVAVDTAPGEGATFEVRLPLHRTQGLTGSSQVHGASLAHGHPHQPA